MSDNQYMNRNTNGSRPGGNYGGYNDAQRRTSGSPARTPSGAGRPQTGGSSVPVRRSPAQPVRSQQPDRSRAVVKRNSGHPAKKTAAKKVRDIRPDGNSGGGGGLDDRTGNTAVTSLLKAVIYIMSILVISGFLSYFAITAGNDIFAFVKEDTEVSVTIEEGTDIKALGAKLADELSLIHI